MSRERVGLYPGTFDPITNGHIDIIQRAMKLVDRLIVAVAVNRDKGPLFTLEERSAMVVAECEPLSGKDGRGTIEARPFEGLLMDYARQHGAGIVVRGLRGVVDYEYEHQMVGMNRRLNPDVETVFLTAHAEYQSIASRLVKEIARMGGDIGPFVPPGVAAKLLERIGRT